MLFLSKPVVVLPPTSGIDAQNVKFNASPFFGEAFFSFTDTPKRLMCNGKEAVGERFLCTDVVTILAPLSSNASILDAKLSKSLNVKFFAFWSLRVVSILVGIASRCVVSY